jgi:predicted nucleic acid-binding protein
MAFVIDASATLPWCFEDEATPGTDRLLFDLRAGDTAAVPAHWPLEVLNSLLIALRRGRIPREKIERFWSDLTALAIRVQPTELAAWSEIHRLAEQYRLTAYDAAYLELAQRIGLPLATLDGDLRKAAAAAGAALVEFHP